MTTAATRTDLPAGQEMDARIAGRVFGCRVLWFTGLTGETTALCMCDYAPHAWRGYDPDAVLSEPRLRPYSADIADAMLVVDYCIARGWGVEFKYEQGRSRQWVASVVTDEWYGEEALAPTAPLAVCRAVLSVLALEPRP